jgi:uncharacterized protein
MNIEQIRNHLNYLDIDRQDMELLINMRQQIIEVGNGIFLKSMIKMLQQYEKGESIRPSFPNRMQFIYMRDRQNFSFILFPELLPIAYQVGRAIGAAFDAPRRTGNTLKEAMYSAIDVAEQFDYGRQEIVLVKDNFAIYRTYECADCFGLPNLGIKLCAYEAGVAAGALEITLKKPVKVVEVRCCANGDPFDEFEVYVKENDNEYT